MCLLIVRTGLWLIGKALCQDIMACRMRSHVVCQPDFKLMNRKNRNKWSLFKKKKYIYIYIFVFITNLTVPLAHFINGYISIKYVVFNRIL